MDRPLTVKLEHPWYCLILRSTPSINTQVFIFILIRLLNGGPTTLESRVWFGTEAGCRTARVGTNHRAGASPSPDSRPRGKSRRPASYQPAHIDQDRDGNIRRPTLYRNSKRGRASARYASNCREKVSKSESFHAVKARNDIVGAECVSPSLASRVSQRHCKQHPASGCGRSILL